MSSSVTSWAMGKASATVPPFQATGKTGVCAPEGSSPGWVLNRDLHDYRILPAWFLHRGVQRNPRLGPGSIAPCGIHAARGSEPRLQTGPGKTGQSGIHRGSHGAHASSSLKVPPPRGASDVTRQERWCGVPGLKPKDLSRFLPHGCTSPASVPGSFAATTLSPKRS